MQKKFLVVFSVISILGLLFGVAAAPAATKSLTLDDVRFIDGKGYVFLFSFTGNFKQSELSGFVTIGNHGFDLACKLRDDGKISCVAIQLPPSYAGRQAVVHLAGYIFYAIVPGLPCNSLDVTISIYVLSTGDLFDSVSLNVSMSDFDLIKSQIEIYNTLSNYNKAVISSATCSPRHPSTHAIVT